MASNWANEKTPYETLELERDAGEDKIKSAYRRLAKFYHPDGLLLAQVKQLCCLKFRMIKFMKFFLS